MARIRSLLVLLLTVASIGECRVSEPKQDSPAQDPGTAFVDRCFIQHDRPHIELRHPRPHTHHPHHHPDSTPIRPPPTTTHQRHHLLYRPHPPPPLPPAHLTGHDPAHTPTQVGGGGDDASGGGGGRRAGQRENGGDGGDNVRRRDTEDNRETDKEGKSEGSKSSVANSVDNVLAALVGYSRDPTLWHFVHSVVDELDYSRKASSQANPPRHHLAHLPPHHITWPEDKSQNRRTGKNDSKTPLEGSDEGRRRDEVLHHNSSLIAPSSNHTSSSTHPPTFIFHKVFINTRYDPHTRQSYNRPVLAVAAFPNDTTTTTNTIELPERLERFTGLHEQNEMTIDARNDLRGVDDQIETEREEGRREERERGKETHRKANSIQAENLDTFEGQLAYLRRWEERLRKKSQTRRSGRSLRKQRLQPLSPN